MEKLKEKFIKQFGATFTGEDDWIPPFQVWEFIEQNCQPKQVKVEPEVKPANGDTIKIINEFFDDYLLDKDNCFYIDSLKFKNNISFAALILLQAKIDLLSRLSV